MLVVRALRLYISWFQWGWVCFLWLVSHSPFLVVRTNPSATFWPLSEMTTMPSDYSRKRIIGTKSLSLSDFPNPGYRFKKNWYLIDIQSDSTQSRCSSIFQWVTMTNMNRYVRGKDYSLRNVYLSCEDRYWLDDSCVQKKTGVSRDIWIVIFQMWWFIACNSPEFHHEGLVSTDRPWRMTFTQPIDSFDWPSSHGLLLRNFYFHFIISTISLCPIVFSVSHHFTGKISSIFFTFL